MKCHLKTHIGDPVDEPALDMMPRDLSEQFFQAEKQDWDQDYRKRIKRAYHKRNKDKPQLSDLEVHGWLTLSLIKTMEVLRRLGPMPTELQDPNKRKRLSKNPEEAARQQARDAVEAQENEQRFHLRMNLLGELYQGSMVEGKAKYGDKFDEMMVEVHLRQLAALLAYRQARQAKDMTDEEYLEALRNLE